MKAVEVVVDLIEPLVGLNWPGFVDLVDLVDSDLSRDGSLDMLAHIRGIVDDVTTYQRNVIAARKKEQLFWTSSLRKKTVASMVKPAHVDLLSIIHISDRAIMEHAHDLAKPNLCGRLSLNLLLLQGLGTLILSWTDNDTVSDLDDLSIDCDFSVASLGVHLPSARFEELDKMSDMLSVPALLPELFTVDSHIDDTLELPFVLHLGDDSILVFHGVVKFFGDKESLDIETTCEASNPWCDCRVVGPSLDVSIDCQVC